MFHKDPPALRRYLRFIRSWIPCPGRMKRIIVEDVRENALAFLNEHPEADYAQLEARFGTPARLAANYISDMDTAKLLTELRMKRRITAVVASVLVAALLLWAAGLAAVVADYRSLHRGYHIITTIVETQPEGTE